MDTAEVVVKKQPGRRYARSVDDPLKRRHCSRVTNGKILIPGVDQRSPWIRRCKDIIREHIADKGGIENCSAAEKSIIRRAAVLTTELEMLEQKFALAGEAEPTDLDLYQRTANSLRRLLECVGIERRAKNITPNLSEYLSDQDVVDADAV
jgi:hypothetical protein